MKNKNDKNDKNEKTARPRGRPSMGVENKVSVNYRLDKEVVDFLRGDKLPAAQIIEQAVRDYKDALNT